MAQPRDALRDEVRCGVQGDEDGRLTSALTEHGLALTDADAEVVVVLGGFDAVRDAAAAAALVVAAADRPDRRSVSVLLELGASGVVSRDEAPAAIAAAVRAVAAGFLVVPAAARRAMIRPILTSRQKQILSLVVLGMSNAEIAERLFISEITVKTHLTKVFSALGVRSRKEAIDLIHDPTSGLGAGILGIPEAARLRQGYGRPRFGG